MHGSLAAAVYLTHCLANPQNKDDLYITSTFSKKKNSLCNRLTPILYPKRCQCIYASPDLHHSVLKMRFRGTSVFLLTSEGGFGVGTFGKGLRGERAAKI